MTRGRSDMQPGRDDDVLSGEVGLDDVCRCGHRRRDHMAATGALGSFGGSACNECWRCGTFVCERPVLNRGAAEATT